MALQAASNGLIDTSVVGFVGYLGWVPPLWHGGWGLLGRKGCSLSAQPGDSATMAAFAIAE